MRSRNELPEKICAQCGRPFAWRRKWQRDWGAVRYCSIRCRGAASTARRAHRPNLGVPTETNSAGAE